MQTTLQDLHEEYRQYSDEAGKQLSDWRTYANRKATADYHYNIELSKKIVELLEQYPTTVVEKIARGDEKIAKNKATYLLNESLEKAAAKAHDHYKALMKKVCDDMEAIRRGE
jgi:gas vesicle protein